MSLKACGHLDLSSGLRPFFATCGSRRRQFQEGGGRVKTGTQTRTELGGAEGQGVDSKGKRKGSSYVASAGRRASSPLGGARPR
eukprot:2803212-Pleurochrysis_carterae.AAC.2